MSMRQRANWSLAILTVFFFTILVLRFILQPVWWLDAALFIVEAGMVGALADWFAVSALFRHPLGLKWIPHTAIIPRKKQQLIDGVVKLVEEQLLDRNLIGERLSHIAIVPTIIEYVGRNPLALLEEVKIKKLIAKFFVGFITPKNVAKAESSIEAFIYQAPLSQWLGQGIALLQKNNSDAKLINSLLDVLYNRLNNKDVPEKIKLLLSEATTEMTEASFFKRLLFQAAEAINAVNLDDAAHIIYEDLLQLVKDMKDEQHPVRLLLTNHIAELSQNLSQNDDINAVLRVWLANLLYEFKLQAWLPEWLLQFFQLINEQEGTKTVELLTKLLRKWINAIWNWFIDNEAAQLKVESYIKSFLTYLLQNEYKIIGEVVQSTLNNFTDERLVEFIESKVETDLQRIRLNGTLIGALIGAFIYVFLYGIYTPILNLF